MAKSRFTQPEILSILQKARDGASITSLCCDNRISGATFYQWRRKFSGKGVNTVAADNVPVKNSADALDSNASK